MLYKDVIDLMTEIESVNDIGNVIKVPTYRQVFANRKSIRQSEFYQAQATGLRPEIMFEVRSIEYEDEETLRYNGKNYSIIRVYDKGEITELICSGVVNNG